MSELWLIVRRVCRRHLGITVLVVGWALAVAAGFVVLMDYQNAPGTPADAPSSWPSETSLQRVSSKGALIVFAHPRCSCTRATMGELARLMRHVQDHVVTHVVFVQPEGYDRARRFGAFTSGQVLYYDADKQLRFAGGITGSRGHEGNNKGRQALRDLILTGTAPRASSFVFGCALQKAPLNEWKHFKLSSSSSVD